MATRSLPGGSAGEQRGAIAAKHWLEREWERSPLPPSVWRRLWRVERSLYAMGSIHALLLAAEVGKADAEISGCGGMDADDREGLHLALAELGSVAEVSLEEIRSDRTD